MISILKESHQASLNTTLTKSLKEILHSLCLLELRLYHQGKEQHNESVSATTI